MRISIDRLILDHGFNFPVRSHDAMKLDIDTDSSIVLHIKDIDKENRLILKIKDKYVSKNSIGISTEQQIKSIAFLLHGTDIYITIKYLKEELQSYYWTLYNVKDIFFISMIRAKDYKTACRTGIQ